MNAWVFYLSNNYLLFSRITVTMFRDSRTYATTSMEGKNRIDFDHPYSWFICWIFDIWIHASCLFSTTGFIYGQSNYEWIFGYSWTCV